MAVGQATPAGAGQSSRKDRRWEPRSIRGPRFATGIRKQRLWQVPRARGLPGCCDVSNAAAAIAPGAVPHGLAGNLSTVRLRTRRLRCVGTSAIRQSHFFVVVLDLENHANPVVSRPGRNWQGDRVRQRPVQNDLPWVRAGLLPDPPLEAQCVAIRVRTGRGVKAQFLVRRGVGLAVAAAV